MRDLEAPGLLLLTLLWLLPLAGCVNQGEEARRAEPPPADVFRFDSQTPFGTLTRLEQNMPGSSFLFPFLYSFLFVPSGTGRLEPDLAESWSSDEGGRTWTIRIRPDARFHDDTAVAAGDVMASIATGLRDWAPAIFDLIADMKTLSRDSLQIHLKCAEPGFLDLIWKIPILPASGGDGKPPVGSGPYRFRWRDGANAVELEANEHYYGKKPSIQTIRSRYEPDRQNSWARLISGKTDLVLDIQPKDYRMIHRLRDRFQFSETVVNSCQVLLFNTTRPPFSDPRVRLAVSLAINRQMLVDEVLGGAGVVGVGPMGVDSPYRDPELRPVPYAPKRSLEILGELGWHTDPSGRVLVKDGRPFEITLHLFEGAEPDRRAAELIQLFLIDIGIVVHLKPLPAGAIIQRYLGNTDFEAVLTEFLTAGKNPALIARLWAETGNTASMAGCFDDAEVDHLFERAWAEDELKDRVPYYRRIDARIAELQPGAFLFHRVAFDAMSNRVRLDQPFRADVQGLWRLRFATLEGPREGQSSLSTLLK